MQPRQNFGWVLPIDPRYTRVLMCITLPAEIRFLCSVRTCNIWSLYYRSTNFEHERSSFGQDREGGKRQLAGGRL
jgi:hypothetical protein